MAKKKKSFLSRSFKAVKSLFKAKKILLPTDTPVAIDESFINRINTSALEKLDKNFIETTLANNIKSSNPDGCRFLFEMANYLLNAGYPDEAADLFEQSLELRHDNLTAIIYLQCLMYTSPEVYDLKRIYEISKKVMSSITGGDDVKPFKEKLTNSIKTDRILNIGYTCHFFDNSTSTTLLLPIIEKHNRERVKIFIYSDQDKKVTKESTKNLADVWHDTYGMADEDFCRLVRKDEIDVLVELNGFCHINRYRAINMRCAPVQLSYYNVASTCGAREMDYVLSSEEIKTDHLQPYYTEEFFHKKGIIHALDLGDHFPEPAKEIPYKKNGYITFGSFGQAHKVSRKQIFVWAEIMKRVPNSKFYFKTNANDLDHCVTAFKNHFKDAGIDLSRIIFEGFSPYKELLKCYEKVDIALDTFPYCAGTTTFEALLQGVPVIAQYGERQSSQIGYMNLYSINHTELMCYSENEFVEKAVKLAHDIEGIQKYRTTLPADIKNSPRTDLKKFISDLEDAYFDMYKAYIKKNHMLEKA